MPGPSERGSESRFHFHCGWVIVAAGALVLSVVCYGLAAFALPTIMAAAVSDYFGLSRAATAFSTVTLFFAVGQMVGPVGAGMIAEASGSFTVAFLTSAALTGLAGLSTALLPRPA